MGQNQIDEKRPVSAREILYPVNTLGAPSWAPSGDIAMTSSDFPPNTAAVHFPRHKETYPERAGFKTSGTSAESAEAVDRDPDRKFAVYAAICRACQKHDGLTADEAADAVGESFLYVRPRCSELRKAGILVARGAQRRNRSGRMADVLSYVGPEDSV